MNELVSLEFSLTFRDGRHQTLTVDSHTVLLGSGSHCEVRLPNDDAAAEELQIRLAPGGLTGSAHRLDRPLLLDGVPFVEGRILPGSELSIGSTRVTVRPLEVLASTTRASDASDPSSRAIRIFAALALPLAGYMLLNAERRANALPSVVEAPALWSAAAETCPEQQREASDAFGQAELLRAQALRERAPFSGRNGVAAVSAFERAGACFRVAGSTAAADSARAAAHSLRSKVEHDFQVHRVRLERALATERYDEARTELSLLLPFVGKQSSEYRDWLLALERQIELKFAGKR